MIIFKIIRPKDTVYAAILKHKISGKYSFINLTKEHICPCEFTTVEEAVEDLEKYKRLGKIISFEGPLDEVTIFKQPKTV